MYIATDVTPNIAPMMLSLDNNEGAEFDYNSLL